jgi:hypothetical protein
MINSSPSLQDFLHVSQGAGVSLIFRDSTMPPPEVVSFDTQALVPRTLAAEREMYRMSNRLHTLSGGAARKYITAYDAMDSGMGVRDVKVTDTFGRPIARPLASYLGPFPLLATAAGSVPPVQQKVLTLPQGSRDEFDTIMGDISTECGKASPNQTLLGWHVRRVDSLLQLAIARAVTIKDKF